MKQARMTITGDNISDNSRLEDLIQRLYHGVPFITGRLTNHSLNLLLELHSDSPDEALAFEVRRLKSSLEEWDFKADVVDPCFV
ncbi:MAG: hypothetical protein EOP06_03155 [Proteobacteria bacterium]|nr:MAG: hypothetical protein EOP06_03155 [Pseudomonadota bacterium]